MLFRWHAWPAGALYHKLGVPADPFEPLHGTWKALQPKPFRMIHTDLHRKSMIIRNGRTVFLDWELALYGDPVCDGAIHLHKMGYWPEEHRQFLTAWAAAEPEALCGNWEHDLEVYLVHEKIKSAVLDTVRYAKVIAEGTRTADHEQRLVHSLTDKLAAAAPLWGQKTSVDAAQVDAALRTRHDQPECRTAGT
ncbi:phosphotransferase [Nocardia iowensis]|uniref:Phosphotransferase n=1 Tax=Nocardia iowensis TaxID=204891 RepID=A0ABX8RHN5_NOCIO|nr:phosphotransferase [Nocardia iowensis]QXN88821.1 phosphotransferase [Nocardia iowensis]